MGAQAEERMASLALRGTVLNLRDSQRLPAFLNRVGPYLIDLWLAFVIIVFFIVRILGSRLGQNLIHRFTGGHSA